VLDEPANLDGRLAAAGLETILNMKLINLNALITGGSQGLGKAIAEQYKDIIQIEKQLSNLNQLFIDASILVEQQGDIITSIEHHVEKSLNYVEKGNQQLKQAVSRSQKCTIF